MIRTYLALLLGFLLTHNSAIAQAFYFDSETASYIDAAAYSPGNSVLLFFSGSAIMVYDLSTDTITESVWYDLQDIEEVQAAISWDEDVVLLFNRTQYRQFEVSTASFISELEEWKGLPEEWDNTMDAAVRWSDDEVMFFKDDQYLLYSFSENAYLIYDTFLDWEGYPENWETGLEAVFNVGGDIYFFNDGEVSLYSSEEKLFFEPTAIGIQSE